MIRRARSGFYKTVPIRSMLSNRMGQLVQLEPKIEFKPDVNVQAPLNIELGGLPLSIGLFVGSGLAFVMKPQLPEGLAQSIALVAGAGLAVAGVTNLLMPKAAASASAPVQPSAAPPVTVQPSAPAGGVSATPGYKPSDQGAFDSISGRVSYPADTETVDIWPTASTYPLRVQVYNPSPIPVTFYLEIVADEAPHPFGEELRTTYPIQVTIGGGETRDIDIAMPISSWGPLVDFVDIDLNVYKRRLPNEDAYRIATRFLVVE